MTMTGEAQITNCSPENVTNVLDHPGQRISYWQLSIPISPAATISLVHTYLNLAVLLTTFRSAEQSGLMEQVLAIFEILTVFGKFCQKEKK